jgi:hypothetical protein
MFKPTIIATAMIVLASSSIVLAQQNFEAGNASSDLRGQLGEQRYRPSTEDMAAFADASIAALRAGLELTPNQAKKLAGIRAGFTRCGSTSDTDSRSATAGATGAGAESGSRQSISAVRAAGG